MASRHTRRVTEHLATATFLIAFALLATACGRAQGSRGWAAPVKTDSYLMVSPGKGRLDGLDVSTREAKWRFPKSWQIDDSSARDLTGIYGDPVVAKDGNVYLGDYNGRVYVFRPGDFNASASDKPKAGSLDLGAPIIGGVALDEANNLLFVTSGNTLYSLNTRDLVTRIQNKDAAVKLSKLLVTDGDLWSTPLFADGKVYVSSLDGNVYAIDPTSGEEQWRFTTGKGVVSKSELNNGTLYAGGFGSQLFAIDASSGKEKWAFKAASWVWSRPVLNGGKLYFGDFESNVYAVDPASGEQAWQYNLGHGSIRSAVAVTGSTVVAATEDGWLVGLSNDGSQKRWEKKIDTSISADLIVAGDSVLIAPSGCVKVDTEKAYYISVNPSNGDLARASGVC